MTNIVQPGRFAQLDQDLTFHIRERRPSGVLVGIFIDDRRDPKERVTIIAEQGKILKNENGTFLMLEDGNLQRLEAGKRDPAMVAFDRYAFDLSQFSNRGQDVTLGMRERYLWELCRPPPTIRPTSNCPASSAPNCMTVSCRRSIRSLSPSCLCVSGAPRTTRQSRNFSIGGSILAVFGLRMAGFACSVWR